MPSIFVKFVLDRARRPGHVKKKSTFNSNKPSYWPATPWNTADSKPAWAWRACGAESRRGNKCCWIEGWACGPWHQCCTGRSRQRAGSWGGTIGGYKGNRRRHLQWLYTMMKLQGRYPVRNEARVPRALKHITNNTSLSTHPAHHSPYPKTCWGSYISTMIPNFWNPEINFFGFCNYHCTSGESCFGGYAQSIT